MDKKLGLHASRYKEFDDGLKSFIEHAFAHGFVCTNKVKCPCVDFGVLGENTSGEVSFRDGVAIGPNSTELSDLAGRLGRDANLLPFYFLNWPLVDIEYKDRVMMEIKQHFDFPDECNKYVLKQLNAAWKDEKGDLKREYFIPFATRKDRIANRPNKVPEDQWTVLVEYWENSKTLIDEDPE
ncbi:Uncharacterized protein Fot_27970 [Forsythia ovata]|uniref:Uncharacterized protein n=1 Tax=Forsythia ovata TaxID=205694 RepID=A0ABD1TMT6_9LAMI